MCRPVGHDVKQEFFNLGAPKLYRLSLKREESLSQVMSGEIPLKGLCQPAINLHAEDVFC